MSEVTSPILTDATGQEIVSKLNTLLTKMDNLAAAFQPNASGIVYSNTTSGLTGDDVQEAIDEMAADVSEINSALSQLIKTTTESTSATIGNTNVGWGVTYTTPSGYSLMDCHILTVGYSGEMAINIESITSGQVTGFARNLTGNTRTSTIVVKFIFIKSEMLG